MSEMRPFPHVFGEGICIFFPSIYSFGVHIKVTLARKEDNRIGDIRCVMCMCVRKLCETFREIACHLFGESVF